MLPRPGRGPGGGARERVARAGERPRCATRRLPCRARAARRPGGPGSCWRAVRRARRAGLIVAGGPVGA